MGDQTLIDALRGLGLNPQISVEARHTTLFVAVPSDDTASVRSIFMKMDSKAKSPGDRSTDKACPSDVLTELKRTELGAKNMKVFIAAGANFPIAQWDTLSLGRVRPTTQIKSNQSLPEYTVARSKGDASVLTLTFILPADTAEGVASSDVLAPGTLPPYCERLTLGSTQAPTA